MEAGWRSGYWVGQEGPAQAARSQQQLQVCQSDGRLERGLESKGDRDDLEQRLNSAGEDYSLSSGAPPQVSALGKERWEGPAMRDGLSEGFGLSIYWSTLGCSGKRLVNQNYG